MRQLMVGLGKAVTVGVVNGQGELEVGQEIAAVATTAGLPGADEPESVAVGRAERFAACWNACENVDTKTLQAMGPGTMERMRDRYHVERMAGIRLRKAANALVGAFGGQLPDWLKMELEELDAATTASSEAAEGRGLVPLPMTAALSVSTLEAMRCTMRALDRVAEGEPFNEVCEESGFVAEISGAIHALEGAAL